MPNKTAVMICMGDYYGDYNTDFSRLWFAMNNTERLKTQLEDIGWNTSPPAANLIATKAHCIAFLQEKIRLLQNDDDWLLVYYVGHADRYSSNNDDDPVFLVTSLGDGRESSYPPDSYFLDTDYDTIVETFRQKAPKGHLITILDCCYAYGMINNYTSGSDFHSVFAACSGNAQAAYTDNSFFFKSLRKSWNIDTFSAMKNAIEFSMRNDYTNYSYVNFCNIQIANNFTNVSF